MKRLFKVGELAHEYRLLVLLFVLIALIIFAPIAEQQGYGDELLPILLVLVIGASVNAAREHVSLSVLVVVVGLTAACLQLLRLVFDQTIVEIGNEFAYLALMFLTTSLVLRNVLIVHASNFNTLCGAAAVYLLFGITWASSFNLIAQVYPGAFSGLREGILQRWNDLMYFSFATLTTLGYGDVAPTNAFARIWSTLEAVTGTLYLTTLVARLVAIYQRF